MYISHKSNVIQQTHETEWQCRRRTKGLTKPEYWAWEETIKDSDGVPDYSGETDYSIVETEVDVEGFKRSGHITSDIGGKYYHLKWDASKKEVVKDDDAKTAWEVAEEWKLIRSKRDRLLTNSDWTQGADSPLASGKKTEWATYRTKLRTLPEDQKDKTTYASITWPSEPS